MRLWLAIVLTICATLAAGQTYLVHPSLAACLARSAAQCAALGCDGIKTKYWWSCQVLASATTSGGISGSGGSTALQIRPGDPAFDVTTTINVATPTGLSSAEQSSIQTTAQLGLALPNIISTPTFDGRFTAAQKIAIASSTQGSAWTTIQGAAVVNLAAPSVTNFISAIVSLGIIPASQTVSILFFQPTIASP